MTAAGRPAGLLTFTRPNVDFYQRRGYRLVAQEAFEAGAFTMWAMLQDPA
jgi:hypothetical protein